MDEWLSIAETAHLHRDSTKVSKMLSTSLGGDDKLTSFAISQVCCCFCGLFVIYRFVLFASRIPDILKISQIGTEPLRWWITESKSCLHSEFAVAQHRVEHCQSKPGSSVGDTRE